jgi:hypothetical protein
VKARLEKSVGASDSSRWGRSMGVQCNRPLPPNLERNLRRGLEKKLAAAVEKQGTPRR